LTFLLLHVDKINKNLTKAILYN